MIGILGHVIVDVTLGPVRKLRFGGVFHAARALWAMSEPYVLAVAAPSYLREEVERYALAHGAQRVVFIGDVKGAPSVILVDEPTEAGPQGYDLLLRSHISVDYHESALASLSTMGVTQWLWFPDDVELARVAKSSLIDLSSVICELPRDPSALLEVARERGPFKTVITSYSSAGFAALSAGGAADLTQYLQGCASEVLFKENRGGSRLFHDVGLQEVISTPAHPARIQHSIGVGDAFNAAFLAISRQRAAREALAYAAWIATEYASTTYPDDFKAGVDAILAIPPDEVVSARGVLLPWEVRPSKHVYVAGPDFDYLDTTLIRQVEQALRYHNFTPRMPVKEHGQATHGTERADRRRLGLQDITLLERCSAVIALPLQNDPGTLVEIGFAAARGIPCIVWDPHRNHETPMLLATSKVVPTLDEAISLLFQALDVRGVAE